MTVVEKEKILKRFSIKKFLKQNARITFEVKLIVELSSSLAILQQGRFWHLVKKTSINLYHLEHYCRNINSNQSDNPASTVQTDITSIQLQLRTFKSSSANKHKILFFSNLFNQSYLKRLINNQEFDQTYSIDKMLVKYKNTYRLD